MLMTNFLRDRKSVREFKNKNIDLETIKTIKSYLKSLEEETENVKFKIYENGDYIYDRLKGISGYSGLMVESPHYIALQQINDDRFALVDGAYHMEKLITQLNRLGIETCWISVGSIEADFKETVFGEHTGNIDYMLAIGYGKKRNPFIKQSTSERLGVDEIVCSGNIGKKVDEQELEHRGLDDLFYYVRFAPSRWNRQPWRFLLDKNKVTLLIRYDEKDTHHLVEAGIIMYYFKELAKTIGLENEWQTVEGIYDGEDAKYEYVAEYKL